MSDQWNPDQISTMDDFSLLDYAGKTLFDEELCSRAMGGSLAFKRTILDLYELEIEALVFRTSKFLTTDDTTLLRLESLKKLMELPAQPKSLTYELIRSRLDDDIAVPDVETLLHAIIPKTVTMFTTSNTCLALGGVSIWKDLIQDVFNGRLLPIDHLFDKWDTIKRVKQQIKESDISVLDGIFLRYRGVITFGENCKDTLKKTIDISHMATRFWSQHESLGRTIVNKHIEEEESLREARSKLRKKISAEIGTPLLLKACCDQISDRDIPVLTDIFSRTFSPDSTSQITTSTKLGHSVTAKTPAQLNRNQDVLEHTIKIAELAIKQGTLEPLPVATQDENIIEEARMFDGEIALVTGAASGIGKGVVMALIERGAAVVGLDIQPEILTLTHSPNYLGIICNLESETEIKRSFEEVVKTFGGLDMLVLNAGLFPDSCNIEELALDHWQKVMKINLDANVTLFREAYPLLKNAPRYGRVVINASRNVPAPGPGAAAYSSSKAALTQLGRVAALEWGKSGVRVNMVNPHAVFDTAIWTQEVLQARADMYGITVEEYKTNNVLGVELTSQDVGELVAEICGPLFSKITGAQIPIDGGSERVI